jgi:hypothetical protein
MRDVLYVQQVAGRSVALRSAQTGRCATVSQTHGVAATRHSTVGRIVAHRVKSRRLLNGFKASAPACLVLTMRINSILPEAHRYSLFTTFREFVLLASCGEENPRKRAQLLHFLNVADYAT